MKIKAWLFVFLTATLFIACKKQDGPLPVQPSTYLNFVNLSTDILNIYQNGNRLNRLTSVYPSAASGYLIVTAGQQNFQFRRYTSAEILLTLPLNLDTLKSYSLFAAAPAAQDMFLTDDSFTLDTGAVSMVRFVNASPDSTSLDISLKDTSATGTTFKFTGKRYRSVSAFTAVPSGTKELKVFLAGSTSAVVTDTVILSSGQAYTIFAKGKQAATGDGIFGVGIINNQ